MSVLDQDGLLAEVVQRLRAAATEDRTFDAAQMQLINLPEIIARAGTQWPLLKDRIRMGSVSFLKGCLEEDDLVIPAGNGFLIIFARGDPAVLKRRAEELRSMLLEFYLGQDGFKNLGIKVEHRQISSKEIHAIIAPPPPPSAAPSTDSCLFAPVWTPGPQVIASYFCFPVHHEQGGPRYGYDEGFSEDGKFWNRDYCSLDLALLDVTEAALARYRPEDTRPAIGVPVHSTTMQNRLGRAAYLERLAKIPHQQLKYVYIKIAEIERGAPTINLADWVGMLRARVKTVLLEFHYSDVTPANLMQIGISGAGFQAPLSWSRESADPNIAMRQMTRWGEALSRQRLRFFVDNLRRPGLIRAAADAGANLITSDNFWPLEKWPGAVVSAHAPSGAPQRV